MSMVPIQAVVLMLFNGRMPPPPSHPLYTYSVVSCFCGPACLAGYRRSDSEKDVQFPAVPQTLD